MEVVNLGVKDTISKQYMRNSSVFADLFNYMIYSGRQVIQPDSLYSLDSTIVHVPYGADGAALAIQRERDVFKYLAAMTDNRAAYLLLGIENQSTVHYAMPVKSMVYDALAYAMQVEEAARSHRKKKDAKQHSAGEYLSGFYKEDRLIPVITAVVYLSPDPWDGPLCLYDMLATEDSEILSFVENYKIHLITPEGISVKELEHFQSTLYEVMGFIKYSKDKEKLRAFVMQNPNFVNLDQEAVRMITCCTNVKITMDETEEVNMCKAIDDMMEDAREEGRLEIVKALMDVLGPEVIAEKTGVLLETVLQLQKDAIAK